MTIDSQIQSLVSATLLFYFPVDVIKYFCYWFNCLVDKNVASEMRCATTLSQGCDVVFRSGRETEVGSVGT